MQGNKRLSSIKNLFFVSPFVLLIFLIIPFYSILGIIRHLPVSGNLLLFNNCCFLIIVTIRFVRYVRKLRCDIRYGADYRQPKSVTSLDRPMQELKGELDGVGYRFDSGGRYGEKRDMGYLGTTLLYGGLFLLLLFGSYDFMREYSIMVRMGVGEPMSLDGKGLTGQFEAGTLAATSRLPLLQVRRQILPNAEWPKGATEIALVNTERKELAKAIIAPGKPFRYRGLDFHMTKFIFDALLMVRKDKTIVYESFVKFLPLPQKKGVYSYYGSLKNDKSENVGGAAWLNPEDKAVHAEATLDGKKIVDTELKLWGKNKITQGEYVASLEGLAHWSEIRVARGRHRNMLIFGAVLAVFGGFLRIVIRPQRVWLEEAEEGCRVRSSGGKTKKLLTLAGKQ